MNSRMKTTGLGLAVAVAVAFGAYALGSQSGGGNAGAAGASSSASASGSTAATGNQQAHLGGRGPGGAGFDDLASRLGVTPEKLRSALQAVRGQLGAGQDPRGRLASELATALGLPADQVTAALQKVLPIGPRGAGGPFGDDGAALAKALALDPAKVKAALDQLKANGTPDGPDAIAKALGVTPEKLRAALETLRADDTHRFGPFSDANVAALAKALGLDEAKVKATLDQLRANGKPDGPDAVAKALGITPEKLRDALRSLRPDRGGPGHRFGADTIAADLAKELNVDVDKVRAALDKVRGEEQQRFQKLQDRFAELLAQELGIPVEKVKQALPDGPFHGRRHR
jgi:DNA-binding Lrp family transcriptional regulator